MSEAEEIVRELERDLKVIRRRSIILLVASTLFVSIVAAVAIMAGWVNI